MMAAAASSGGSIGTSIQDQLIAEACAPAAKSLAETRRFSPKNRRGTGFEGDSRKIPSAAFTREARGRVPPVAALAARSRE